MIHLLNQKIKNTNDFMKDFQNKYQKCDLIKKILLSIPFLFVLVI